MSSPLSQCQHVSLGNVLAEQAAALLAQEISMENALKDLSLQEVEKKLSGADGQWNRFSAQEDIAFPIFQDRLKEIPREFATAYQQFRTTLKSSQDVQARIKSIVQEAKEVSSLAKEIKMRCSVEINSKELAGLFNRVGECRHRSATFQKELDALQNVLKEEQAFLNQEADMEAMIQQHNQNVENAVQNAVSQVRESFLRALNSQ